VCGIALIVGHGADIELLGEMLNILAPRGEIEEAICDAGVLAGAQRLRIVDRDRAVQPWLSRDGRVLLCYDGEVFNYRQLRAELTGLGHDFRTESDTEVVLEAFLEWGDRAVGRLRGEFALAITDRVTGQTYVSRDPVGVKPLFWSHLDGRLYLASEVKALVPVGATVQEVPPGHHGWASAATPPVLAPYVDLTHLGEDGPALEDPAEAAGLVRRAVEDSIRVRIDTDLTVGVILSGGLDSSIVLHYVRELHPDCVALTIGAPGSDDVAYARRLTAELGVPHEVIELPPAEIRADDIREAIRLSELTEYGDIVNAVASVPLFARARALGLKVVLTGDGSDELFGGYAMFDHQIAACASRRLFAHIISNLYRTELQRVDRVSMAHGVETRLPYLDLSVVELAMRLPVSLKIRGGQEKWIMRQAFADVLPGYITQRPKDPMSHSSGLHERARLYRPLFTRMYRSLGYEQFQPLRRDFSVLLGQCGHDLDRALARSQARPDYTPLEHARDLAGALRWNAPGALDRYRRGRAHRPQARHRAAG
jgi:asparagine synthase (glutamine-hydrolysing)